MKSEYEGAHGNWASTLRRVFGERTLEDEIEDGLALQTQRKNENDLIAWCNDRLRKIGRTDIEVYRKQCEAENDWGGSDGIYLRWTATKVAVPGCESIDIRRYVKFLCQQRTI